MKRAMKELNECIHIKHKSMTMFINMSKHMHMHAHTNRHNVLPSFTGSIKCLEHILQHKAFKCF